MLNIVARMNELKTLTKHISCECKCKVDRTSCNSGQWGNNGKYHVWNPATCNYQNGK